MERNQTTKYICYRHNVSELLQKGLPHVFLHTGPVAKVLTSVSYLSGFVSYLLESTLKGHRSVAFLAGFKLLTLHPSLSFMILKQVSGVRPEHVHP